MTVKPLTEQYLEFLSLKGGCTGSSKSTLVKMPRCWKSHHGLFVVIEALMVNSPIRNKNGSSFLLARFLMPKA